MKLITAYWTTILLGWHVDMVIADGARHVLTSANQIGEDTMLIDHCTCGAFEQGTCEHKRFVQAMANETPAVAA